MPDYPINPDTATMKFNFKVIVSICIATIAYTQFVYSQANCNNVDFEDGNFTNWIGSTGTCCPISTPTNGIVPAQHSVVSGAGFDVVVPTLPIVSPFGGTYSVKLGNEKHRRTSREATLRFSGNGAKPKFYLSIRSCISRPWPLGQRTAPLSGKRKNTRWATGNLWLLQRGSQR